jgi:hypothetical protein
MPEIPGSFFELRFHRRKFRGGNTSWFFVARNSGKEITTVFLVSEIPWHKYELLLPCQNFRGGFWRLE